ncbi:FAD-dependent oxidoreductase [Paraburkholderia sp. BL10I2N1]|uniref:FAD-dependent oxidoreductase n=1 Tax=Paraburkholderia sp. BL10I2N1 TaxID=1938796 RepID=UPI00105ED8E2|nr:FAD-dependent oxidoreductase [Paraburkholderia sp. BL10I2N1]TDN63792.1 FAD binding domain-containing protein [Paraburkholderia sp. BL10I2N1]
MSVMTRETAAPQGAGKFDEQFDIVVVGAGAAGLACALFAAWQDNKVLLLEKAPELGGTAKKAAFWYWVPNNRPMREQGIEDRKEDCLRYMARLSRPETYSPELPRFGMTQWEFDMCEAIYDNASLAAELLADKGALEYRHCPDVPDYWAELPEDKAPKGRVLLPKGACESMSDGGAVAVRSMTEAARRAGVDIRTSCPVKRLVTDETSAVTGVEVDDAQRGAMIVKARKAVIFGTGGFTHNKTMRKNFLSAPVFGGCAARTNEGDFVRIGTAVGAELRNMNYSWMCPIVLEKALNDDPGLIGTFSPSGDSMIYVNRHGERVTNEKLAYNESAQAFFKWDPAKSEYPNLVLAAIWDARSQQHSASTEYGRFIVPEGVNDAHVIKADTLTELARKIRERVAKLAPQIGNLTFEDDFDANLPATVERFNGFARSGKDLDFARGERPVELLFNGATAPGPACPNPTMYPLSESGPFYATLLTGGNLDTKGGPVTNPEGQVLDHTGQAIPGLYGVGNCVASASARAYWAGGATLGPILAFSYLAARSAHRQTPR